MNAYVQKLGFDTDLYEFVDVISTDDWALDMIPQPVGAVIMLFPLTAKQLAHEKQTEAVKSTDDANQNVWFIRQRIGNACGTIGLLHVLLNTPEPLCQFRPESWLETFQALTVGKSPLEKAELLEGDSTIATLHDAATASEENATGRGDLDDDIITHFIALVGGKDTNDTGNNDTILYELDGRKPGPVPHGKTAPLTLLSDACAVIKEFMARDPDEIRFTILALAPKPH